MGDEAIRGFDELELFNDGLPPVVSSEAFGLAERHAPEEGIVGFRISEIQNRPGVYRAKCRNTQETKMTGDYGCGF